MTTPTHSEHWTTSTPFDFTGTHVAYISKDGKTVLQTRCESHEEAEAVAAAVVAAMNARPAQPVTVSEDAVKRFISELQKNARAYVKAGEIYIDEADGYTPAFIIDGEWTVGALQDALAAAIGRGGA